MTFDISVLRSQNVVIILIRSYVNYLAFLFLSHYHILLHDALLIYAFTSCTMYLHACVYVYVFMLRYMCACVCVCMCMYVCICVHIYLCVCMCVYIQ